LEPVDSIVYLHYSLIKVAAINFYFADIPSFCSFTIAESICYSVFNKTTLKISGTTISLEVSKDFMDYSVMIGASTFST